VTEAELQASVLKRHGLRIEPQMARYALGRLADWPELALIGVDARTGVPRRQIIPRDSLTQDASNNNNP
jgi:hypothetical protein